VVSAILVSLAVVFVAELGDKSQLITMTYSLRHRWWVVLFGVGIAAILVHGLSVAIGHFLGLTLPARPIAFVASIAFLLFAVWTWREGRNDDGDDDVKVAEPRFVVVAIVSSFVLAELGDKTMLATVALASDRNWTGVWVGATIGMILADGVAIAAGALLHKRLPERFLHAMASVLFLIFGLFLFFDGGLGQPRVAVLVAATVAVIAVGAGMASWIRSRRARPEVPASPDTKPDTARPATGY
jgi:putative Ca2+/H+ antiporter (TMEM165/GDT1 family)